MIGFALPILYLVNDNVRESVNASYERENGTDARLRGCAAKWKEQSLSDTTLRTGQGFCVYTMAKGRKGRRRGGDESSDDEGGEEDGKDVAPIIDTSKLNFAQKRDLKRQEAAKKRLAKQRCYLCGQLGHTRRACKGFEDDGKGMSKFTKTKGDSGALHLKKSGRGKKGQKNEPVVLGLELPDGFERHMKNSAEPDAGLEMSCDGSVGYANPFLYYDAMCDGFATLQYLQTGRSGAMFQKTKQEAVEEYRGELNQSSETSNFGGCIAQVHIKTNQDWTADTPLPSPWLSDGEGSLPVSFVIGLNHGYDCIRNEDVSKIKLQEACQDPRVVGLCSKLDYSEAGYDREAQLARLRCTCSVAAEANVPVQIKLLPGATCVRDSETEEESPYDVVMRDLQEILETPTHSGLKVHLCSWSGRADDMIRILQAFPLTVWMGMDGSVSFSKAAQAHECAFDVPLDKLLLETGNNIPAPVASALGRQAFPHSGLIPYVAAAVAQQKKSVSAEEIARASSENLVNLYKL